MNKTTHIWGFLKIYYCYYVANVPIKLLSLRHNPQISLRLTKFKLSFQRVS